MHYHAVLRQHAFVILGVQQKRRRRLRSYIQLAGHFRQLILSKSGIQQTPHATMRDFFLSGNNRIAQTHEVGAGTDLCNTVGAETIF